MGTNTVLGLLHEKSRVADSRTEELYVQPGVAFTFTFIYSAYAFIQREESETIIHQKHLLHKTRYVLHTHARADAHDTFKGSFVP